MIFWEQKKTAHMKRAPRNRHDTSSRPTGWILHVMFRLWKHLISSSYLPWEECTALFAWKPRRRRRRKSSSSLCSLPPSKLRPSISSRSSSQCIHHVRPHPHWYVCLHTAITRLIGSSQRKLAASKMQEMTPSSSFPTISFFFYKIYKHRHYHPFGHFDEFSISTGCDIWVI